MCFGNEAHDPSGPSGHLPTQDVGRKESPRPQRPHRIAAPEEVEEGALRRAALRLRVGIALDQTGVIAGGLQTFGMGAEVGQPHVRPAALPHAQKLAGARAA
jgi:hypothetical protein